MAFDPTPTTWLAGWSENGTDITVPIATFPELTAGEADAATGDIRKIVFAIIEKFWQSYNATATADRPVKWTMVKMASVDAVRNVMLSRYQFTMETAIGTQDVTDETSSSPTATPTATSTPTSSSSGTSTSTGSSSATFSISGSDTASHTQSASSTASATSTPTGTSSGSSTSTSTPTATATA